MTTSKIPTLPCMCASLRRAARAVTQLYEDALRPLGLRVTQFTILQALSLAGEVTQRELGELLAIDSTTLTRSLDLLGRRGWVTRRRGDDRRQWRLRLSRAGESELERATPHWQKAQRSLRTHLGHELWAPLMQLTDTITRTSTKEGALL